MQKPRAADSVEIFGCVFAVGAVAIWLRPLTGQKWKGFGFGSLWVGAFPLPSAEMSPPVCCRQTRSDEMFETQTAALISVTAGLQLWKNYFRTVCFAASFMAAKSDWWSVFTANSAKKSHTEQSSASGSVVTSCFCQRLLTTAVNSYKNMSSGRFGASSSACFYISFRLLVMFLKYLQSQECYLFHDQKHDKHRSCRKLYLVGVTETVSGTRLWTSWLENI